MKDSSKGTSSTNGGPTFLWTESYEQLKREFINKWTKGFSVIEILEQLQKDFINKWTNDFSVSEMRASTVTGVNINLYQAITQVPSKRIVDVSISVILKKYTYSRTLVFGFQQSAEQKKLK